MRGEQRMQLLGIFAGVAGLRKAVGALQSEGFGKLSVSSPVPLPEVEAMLAPRVSPIRLFTLLGGIAGCVTGFWLTIWSSLQWNLITGGKPIAGPQPFVIIAFELTILFGTFATLAGVLLFGRLPTRRSKVAYDPRFSEDRFGLALSCTPSQSGRAEQILRSAGAEEVKIAKG